MIAIFTSKQDAENYSALVHAHLIAHREGYNAERWSFENKSDKKDEWGVKIPPDVDKLKVKMKKKDLEKSIRQDEKYPKDWKDEKDTINIDSKLR